MCIDQDDRFSDLEALKLCEAFYGELYEILGILGGKKDTNCLPITLRVQDYRNSLTYDHWHYFTSLPFNELSSEYVYVLLALPDKKRQFQAQQAKELSEAKSYETLPLRSNQKPVERTVR